MGRIRCSIRCQGCVLCVGLLMKMSIFLHPSGFFNPSSAFAACNLFVFSRLSGLQLLYGVPRSILYSSLIGRLSSFALAGIYSGKLRISMSFSGSSTGLVFISSRFVIAFFLISDFQSAAVPSFMYLVYL